MRQPVEAAVNVDQNECANRGHVLCMLQQPHCLDVGLMGPVYLQIVTAGVVWKVGKALEGGLGPEHMCRTAASPTGQDGNRHSLCSTFRLFARRSGVTATSSVKMCQHMHIQG